MKTFSTLFWAMCSLTMGGAAQSAPDKLYDDFNAKSLLINPVKWFGSEIDDARANRENLRLIQGHATLGNRLHLYGRGYGASGLSLGTIYGNNNLNFRNPNLITAIKASVWVNSAAATGYPGNPDPNDATRVRARLGGNFFNASANPIPGNSTNDVNAQIRLQRASSDPANVLRVQARISLCQDSDCFTGPYIGAEMGTVGVGKKITLSLE